MLKSSKSDSFSIFQKSMDLNLELKKVYDQMHTQISLSATFQASRSLKWFGIQSLNSKLENKLKRRTNEIKFANGQRRFSSMALAN